jgi:hypothetical protein
MATMREAIAARAFDAFRSTFFSRYVLSSDRVC